MRFREACHNAMEYTHRSGDTTIVILHEESEDYNFVLNVSGAKLACRAIPIVAFYATKYGTIEAREIYES